MPYPSEQMPTVNNAICSWARMTFKTFGERIVGLQKIDWKHGAERTPIYGRGGKVIGYTEPIYKAEASIELLLNDSQYLKSYLSQQSGKGFFQQEFNATLEYKPLDLDPITIEFVGCFLNESSSSASAGSSDAIIVPHPLTVREIIENKLPGVIYPQ